MKRTTIIIFAFILQSCFNYSGNSLSFIVKNKSNSKLDSIIVGISKENQTYIRNLAKGQKVNKEIIFNNVKGDGDYFLEIYHKEKIIQSKRFGYFTNGKPLNSSFEISIFKDTTLITPH
jgi:hypothetical protein